MAEIPYIRLADYVFGPEDGTLLLEECLKDPRPRTIGELARMYLARRMEDDKGYMPYDRRRSYRVGDRVALYMHGKPMLAQVIGVTRNYHTDSIGFSYDKIDLEYLDEVAGRSCHEPGHFIANYIGEELAGGQQASLEIIKEEDEAELIPKILMAISGDRRFVASGDYWLPAELLVASVSTRLDDVLVSIAREKRALTTSEILTSLATSDAEERLQARLTFSLNYFLEQDRRFTRTCATSASGRHTVTEWDLRKPSGPIQLEIDRRRLSSERLLNTTAELNLLLCYHGFVSQCLFSLPQTPQVHARYDFSGGSISGDDFVDAVLGLSSDRRYKISFEHPERRGYAIRVCVSSIRSEVAERREATVTVKEGWLSSGTLVLPRRLANYVKGTNSLHILYDQIDELTSYDEQMRCVSQLDNFYSVKAIGEGDRVHIRLQDTAPVSLFVYSRWRRSLDRLLKITPQDLHWERSPLRDCIIVTLAHFKGPAHYREVYAEIARRKHVSITSVIGALSRYCPSVFAHVGWGQWWLAGGTGQEYHPKQGAGEGRKIVELTDEVWRSVATIIEGDWVYGLLQRIKRPLSYEEICEKLADHVGSSASQLKATGFLDADDGRLRRLDDGTWALQEWFGHPEICEDTNGEESEETADLGVPAGALPASGRLTRVVLAIMLTLLFIAVGSVLVWLLVHWR